MKHRFTLVLVLPALLCLLSACDLSPEEVAPTPVSAVVTSTPAPAATEQPLPTQESRDDDNLQGIVYLDNDGVTIKSITPGGRPRTVWTVSKSEGESVESLTVNASGTHLLYGLVSGPEDITPTYFVVRNGMAVEAGGSFRAPRWSPDGRYFAAQSIDEQDERGQIFLYDTQSDAGSNLRIDGLPDWFPDSSKLVYVHEDNVYAYDLTTEESDQLTELPSDEDSDAWVIQEAHVLPAGDRIIFYGAQFTKDGEQMLGASGNGQQWWVIPADGGEPQPWSEAGGNLVTYYDRAAASNWVAYVESAHGNACYSYQSVGVMDAGRATDTPRTPEIAELNEDNEQYVFIKGVTLSPLGDTVAYAVEQYTCPESGTELLREPAAIYTWQVPPDAGASLAPPEKLTDGSLPVWVSAP